MAVREVVIAWLEGMLPLHGCEDDCHYMAVREVVIAWLGGRMSLHGREIDTTQLLKI